MHLDLPFLILDSYPICKRHMKWSKCLKSFSWQYVSVWHMFCFPMTIRTSETTEYQLPSKCRDNYDVIIKQFLELFIKLTTNLPRSSYYIRRSLMVGINWLLFTLDDDFHSFKLVFVDQLLCLVSAWLFDCLPFVGCEISFGMEHVSSFSPGDTLFTSGYNERIAEKNILFQNLFLTLSLVLQVCKDFLHLVETVTSK